jgi:hypothetical protein
MAAPVQTDRINLAKRVGGQINIAAALSLITNNMVSAHSANMSTLISSMLSVAAIGGENKRIVGFKTAEAMRTGLDLSCWANNHGLSSISTLVSATGVDLDRRIGIWS